MVNDTKSNAELLNKHLDVDIKDINITNTKASMNADGSDLQQRHL